MTMTKETVEAPTSKGKKKNVEIVPAAASTPQGADRLIELAITKKASMDTIERLVALRQQLKEEWAREEFSKAMAQFQAECPIIKKGRSVKNDKGVVLYRYAAIEDIIKQVQGLIAKHGFRYSVRQVYANGNVKAICCIEHTAGHKEETEFEGPNGGGTKVMSQIQGVAASYTFAKRYAFLSAFGIMTADEDKDGPDGKQEKVDSERMTPEQKAEIDRLAKLLKLTTAQVTKRVRELYKCSYTDLTAVQAAGVIEMLNKRLSLNV